MSHMELPQEEKQRMMFFEEARQRAEVDHRSNPKDAQVLTRWGGALLELAHFKQGPEAQRAAQSPGGAGGKDPEDFLYDVGGWVCFTGIAISWVVMLMRQQAQPA